MRTAIAFSVLATLASALPAPPAQKRNNNGGGDACSVIAGQDLSEPSDVVACLKSFPFNETVRQNSLEVVRKILPQYTYETEAYDAPAPFQESTVKLPEELSRIENTVYETDYDFNVDLYLTINRLNDGHTLYLPSCYVDAFQNLLPIPIVSLASNVYGNESIYVIPDANEFFDGYLDGEFQNWYSQKGIDITRYAGAEILSIQGQDPYDYVSQVATNYSGNYLDHGVRENSVYSSYRLVRGTWGQRVGDFAGPVIPDYFAYSIEVTLVPTDTNTPETVSFPYVSTYLGTGNFSDAASYYQANCVATEENQGTDYKTLLEPNNATNTSTGDFEASRAHQLASLRGHAKGDLPDMNYLREAINLPPQFQPTIQNGTGGNDALFFSMLPNTTSPTGVMVVGTFSSNFSQFQVLAKAGVDSLLEQGAEYLVIDVTNNGGGYVCLGYFLNRLFSGSSVEANPGTETTLRDSDLARQIVASNIGLETQYNYSEIYPNYWSPSWASVNEPVALTEGSNFVEPPVNVTINGIPDSFAPRFADLCTPWYADVYDQPPFDLKKIAIVGNGNCASTCAGFTTLMDQLHDVPIVNFGAAKEGYNGMNGAQVLEYAAFDSEVKTANLKDSPLAPPEIITNTNFRHNWRASYSYRPGQENVFNAYANDTAKYTFAYTWDTWNNPQNLWATTAKEVFGI